MEENEVLIIYLDDDGTIKKKDVTIIEKTVSYVEFLYRGKLTTIGWHRILKIKEDYDGR